MSELDFIRKLRDRCRVGDDVQTGIGDDGAVMATSSAPTIVVTDMLLDGRHFDSSIHDPNQIGRKAVAVNLSDLAAMACRPTAAFVSLAICSSQSPGMIDEVYAGIEALAHQYQFTIAGGDTNAWPGPFAINVTMLGCPFAESAVLRSGAQPGDLLVVTGALGGSFHSLRHLTFEPRLNVAQWLVQSIEVHAMMDISDGLALDLHRMMEASLTGAVLNAADVPVSSDVDSAAQDAVRLQHALTDGEDFELLFAATPADVQQLIAQDHAFSSSLSVVGKVTADRKLKLRTGDVVTPLEANGWQHL